MDWFGRVGEVRELFRTNWVVGYHWRIFKIFSMPDRLGPVYHSPVFTFLDSTWFLGIYRYGKIVDQEWIGLQIWRSTEYPPRPVRFSIGLMNADKSEYLIHQNQNYPAKDNLCNINEFLPMSVLLEWKDRLAPKDVLTVTCVIWPDAPPPIELNRFCYSESKDNANGKDKNHFSSTTETENGPDPTTEGEGADVDTKPKSVAVSDAPADSDAILREVSRGVEWEVILPPPMSLWELCIPEFTCGEIKCHINLYEGEPHSDSVCLCFVLSISSGTNFPFRICWRMATKRADFAGFGWIMSGKRTVEEGCNRIAEEILIKRKELQSSLTSGDRLTFICHLSVEDVDTDKEVSTQTDITQVSCETQTESELDLSTKGAHGSADVEDLEELSNLCLRNPEGGSSLSVQEEKFEDSFENYLLGLPRRGKKFRMFAA